MRVKHPEWRDSHEPTKFPFSQSATLTNEAGDLIFEGTFLDASFYVIGGGAELYLSKVNVTGEEVTIYIGDAEIAELASSTFDRASPPDELRFVDQYERPAGLIVSESIRLSIFSAWAVGDHEFTTEQTAFVARCCHAVPLVGLRGFELDDGSVVSDDVWLVGDDGVILTCTTEAEQTVCGEATEDVTVVRVDIVGDPLFRRRLCSQPSFFETPHFLETITFCTPGLLDSSSLSSSESSYYSESSLAPGELNDVDVLFLCDTTADMSPYLAQIKTALASVISALPGLMPDITFNWAVAEYKDVIDPVPYSDLNFNVNQAFTASGAAATAAIDTWSASGGDWPFPYTPDLGMEDWLNALQAIAIRWVAGPPVVTYDTVLSGRDTNPKIIVMLGNSGSHDAADVTTYSLPSATFPYTHLAAVSGELLPRNIRLIGCSVGAAASSLDERGQITYFVENTGAVLIDNALSYSAAELTEQISDAIVGFGGTVIVPKVRLVNTTVVTEGTSTSCVKCGPGDFGDMKMFVHTEGATDTILRIRPVPEGLKIETVGERLENIR
jgi:hypothetical protein